MLIVRPRQPNYFKYSVDWVKCALNNQCFAQIMSKADNQRKGFPGVRRYTRSAKTGDLKEFIFVCVCVNFFYHGRPSERTTCGGLCVFLHVYISVHWFRSTYWTKAQHSKWISASLRRVSSSTKANIASIFHASLSIFLFSFFPLVPSVPHPFTWAQSDIT